MRSRPDILVLAGGGVLGQAWMTGVLAGLEDAAGFDFAGCDYFVGTSAGSIVSALLAAGEPLERPGDDDAPREASGSSGSDDNAPQTSMPPVSVRSHPVARRTFDWAVALSAPLSSPGLRLTARPGRVARSLMLRAIPEGRESLGRLEQRIDRTGVRFDGRLRLATVRRSTGARVVFGAPGAPDTTVGRAVLASCTVPWLFPAVEIDGQRYVDGGVWSLTNLDVAPAGRGAHVLCLNPTGKLRGPAPARLISAGSRAGAVAEAGVLRARGARVTLVAPDPDASRTMGTNLMSYAPRAAVLAAGYAQGQALA